MARKHLLETTWQRFKAEKNALQYKTAPLDYKNKDRVFQAWFQDKHGNFY